MVNRNKGWKRMGINKKWRRGGKNSKRALPTPTVFIDKSRCFILDEPSYSSLVWNGRSLIYIPEPWTINKEDLPHVVSSSRIVLSCRVLPIETLNPQFPELIRSPTKENIRVGCCFFWSLLWRRTRRGYFSKDRNNNLLLNGIECKLLKRI